MQLSSFCILDIIQCRANVSSIDGEEKGCILWLLVELSVASAGFLGMLIENGFDLCFYNATSYSSCRDGNSRGGQSVDLFVLLFCSCYLVLECDSFVFCVVCVLCAKNIICLSTEV